MGIEEFSFQNWFSLSWWLTYIAELYKREPVHAIVEIAAFVTIISLLLRKPYNPLKPLTEKEAKELIKDWEPEPLCPPIPKSRQTYEEFVVTSGTDRVVTGVDGKNYVNLCSTNFLGLANSKALKAACRQTIEKYGVGSCGPRGFYGSIDVHIEFENMLAKFLGTPKAIVYSDGIATLASIIPAFTKRGDIIICDEAVNWGIQQGIALSRANVLSFKHNDMADLERTLGLLSEKDERSASKVTHQRMIIVEGISQYHGDITPLDKIVELKNLYKYRLLVDDSLALGVLGKRGRGTPDHFDIPIKEVDLYAGTVDNVLATVGGFCTSMDPDVCSHQVLSGSGYCFSASAPPYTCTAGTFNLKRIDEEPELCKKARQVALWFREKLYEIDGTILVGGASQPSPVCHLRLQKPRGREQDAEFMAKVRKMLIDEGILVDAPWYIPGDRGGGDRNPPAPSIRVSVTLNHSKEDVEEAARTIGKVFKAAFQG